MTYKDFKMVEITVENLESLNLLSQLEANAEIQFTKPGRVGDSAFALLPPREAGEELLEKLSMLKLKYRPQLNLDYGLIVANEWKNVLQRKQLWDTSLRRKDKRHVPFDINNFHSHQDINNYIQDLAKHYSYVYALCIGGTFESREQLVIGICTDGCGKKPGIWVDAGIHAREWISPAAALYMADYLIQTHCDVDEDLINNVDWFILPLLNADGYEHTRDHLSGDRMWRKTRSVDSNGDCMGVDGNRNFGTAWGELGSSPDPCSEDYRGPEPFSEIEIANVRDFLLSSIASNVKVFQSQHASAQLILFPWGFADKTTKNCTTVGNKDLEDQRHLAQLGRHAIHDVNHTRYGVGMTCEIMHPASGIALDWAYDVPGIKYSYTIELTHGMNYPFDAFLVDPEDIKRNGEEMIAFHSTVARHIAQEFKKK